MFSMPASSTALDQLRAQISVRHPQVIPGGKEQAFEGPSRLSTGLTALDELLGGGLPMRAVTAWVGEHGVGWTSLLRSVVHHRVVSGGRVAIVDGARSLEALDWVDLALEDRVLFVRPKEISEASWAAEELAASGAFGLVVLDRPVFPRHRRQAGLEHRLRRAASEGNSALLIIGSGSTSFGAPLVLRGQRAERSWSRGHQTLRMTRTRGGAPREAEVIFDVEERLYACRLPMASPVPDRRGVATRVRSRPPRGVDPGRGDTRTPDPRESRGS
jgi:hypothetical protein